MPCLPPPPPPTGFTLIGALKRNPGALALCDSSLLPFFFFYLRFVLSFCLICGFLFYLRFLFSFALSTFLFAFYLFVCVVLFCLRFCLKFLYYLHFPFLFAFSFLSVFESSGPNTYLKPDYSGYYKNLIQ